MDMDLGRIILPLAPFLTLSLLPFAALSKRTKSSETFLLSSAALANLTFMEPSVVALMRRHGTVKVLVAAIRVQRSVSIYIQDQVNYDQ